MINRSLLRAGVISGALALWAGNAPASAGEYSLTVDRVTIDTGDFTRKGIGYNGASPGPVLRFKEGRTSSSTSPTTFPNRPRSTGTA